MTNPLISDDSTFHWLVFVGIIVLQSTSGIRPIFPTYSSLLFQRHLCSSQVQLNFLAVAWDSGKFLGFFSTIVSEHFPSYVILFIGLTLCSTSYGVQYLYIVEKIPPLSFWEVIILHGIAGNGCSWINTYCNLVAKKHFENNDNYVTCLTSSYGGLNGKIYTSLVKSIDKQNGHTSPTIYLLLSSILPAIVGIPVTLLCSCLKFKEGGEIDIFPTVFITAVATGVYGVFESVAPPFEHVSPRLKVVVLVLVIMLPLATPMMKTARELAFEKWHFTVRPEGSEGCEICIEGVCDQKVKKSTTENKEAKVGDEHGVKELMLSLDFWLYFWVSACGATLGMVYLYNVGRIADSHRNCDASFLLALSSTFSFFGRILPIMFDWCTRRRRILSGPALVLLMMIPMPLSFYLLISDNNICLYISTAILGACSSAITSIASLKNDELFGQKVSAVSQHIIPANIPIGTLLFGYLAADNYDRESEGKHGICIGFRCHSNTFVIWATISSIGTILSFVLYLRTRKYHAQRL